METIIGLPAWVYVVGFIVGAGVALVWYRTKDKPYVENAIELFDDSPLDRAITELAKNMSPEYQTAIFDLVSIMSPITTRTPNDLDDKTLKILQDYLDAAKSSTR